MIMSVYSFLHAWLQIQSHKQTHNKRQKQASCQTLLHAASYLFLIVRLEHEPKKMLKPLNLVCSLLH